MSTLVQDRPALIARDAVLELHSSGSLAQRSRDAARDIADGVRLWRLAFTLGWLDIKLRYRGSLLGPLWLTLSTGVMVAALGVLYSALFKTDVHSYLPFLALSQVLWGFLSGMVGEAGTCFTQAEAVTRSMRMPYFVHALRTLVRNAVILGHNVLVIIAVFAFFRLAPTWTAFWALPGLVLWTIDALAVCLLLGAFCARFRDIPQIVGSIMQIAFFLTPIIWKPDQLKPEQMFILNFNPFYGLMEIVRGPILGEPPNLAIWTSALVFSAVLLLLTWLLFARTRGRIAFWL